MASRRRNALVMQSGGCTNVLNRSLYGLATEFSRSGEGTLFGVPHGFEGLLEGRSVNLSEVSESQWASVANSPGAAIGSTRRKLRDEDVDSVFEYMDRLRSRATGSSSAVTTPPRRATRSRPWQTSEATT